LADGEGRVWLGDQAALAGLGAGASQAALAASAGWISPGAAIQGFIRPSASWNLPRGIEALAWGVTPGTAADGQNGFELSLAGTAEAIQQVAPWLQRFLAAATAMPGAPQQAPEILQESTRIGLRCQLTQEQVDVAMAKLGQAPLPLH